MINFWVTIIYLRKFMKLINTMKSVNIDVIIVNESGSDLDVIKLSKE